MNRAMRFLMGCSIVAVLPVMANAAGTYYTGATYQAPQTRYGQSASYVNASSVNNSSYVRPAGYNTNGYASTRYNSYGNGVIVGQRQVQTAQPQQKSQSKTSKGVQNGFSLNGGLVHENAMWQMEMKESSSVLHYDNVAWNVLDLRGKYVFDVGNSKMQIGAGFKYGMQWGDSTMVDDDITKGGYFITKWVDSLNNVIGTQVGHALSVGTSNGGNMLGFNIDFGLIDAMKFGSLKVTPSIGYRYLKYKLETNKNYGMSVDTLNGSGGCLTDANGETQCDSILIFYNGGIGDTVAVVSRSDTNGDGTIDSNDRILVPSGYQYVYAGDTYYYQQSGTSHSYEVAWSGPYIALDMVYDINDKNSVDARIELGFPGYTATGDQPYRYDWQHPKSIEDTAGMFSALHLGLGANWSTAISDTVSFTVGVTYDYYNVSGADSKTYLNSAYYTGIYDNLLDQWEHAGYTEDDMLNPDTGDPVAINIKRTESECSGWVCKASGEIDSFYRSLGIRVGLNARF